MKPSRVFNVAASLPEKLEALRDLAYNLHWSWCRDTIDLFRRIDRDLWEEVEHNPVRLLGVASQEQLQTCAEDEGFLAHLERARTRLKEYLEATSWARKTYGISLQPLVAYFSAEFGLTECLPLYSGGLGVLAGDYLKSASDIGLPVVGVGLLYQRGYLTQYLNVDGWQQEVHTETDFYNAPISIVRREGQPVLVEVPCPEGVYQAQVWRVQVGRVPLLLLDANLPTNPEPVRRISGQLYAGDPELRIAQEILLGIGGVRALAACDFHPVIHHMNEGHAAFLALERIRVLMQQGLNFDEARVAASAGLVFTTHTPVPAGSDRFGRDMIERHLGAYLHGFGMSTDAFMALGRERPGQDGEPLCTTALALRLAASSFGVSKLHGRTSRRIWRSVWPNVPEDDVPIGAVSNGVHIPSWVSKEMADLFDRYLGPRWRSQPVEAKDWAHVDHIPDEELWQVHEQRRQRLVAVARRRLREQLARRGAPAAEIEEADEALHPHALTIVFARRVAAYKRALLLFHDLERLRRIVSRVDRPVQIIFAGKAHPADREGKEIIRKIIHTIRDPQLRRRIVFLENYDMTLARYLVQGADVWLNTPRRPLEASGTSGMKAAANGALNFSVLDGWWCEAYEPDTGWAIGQGEEYDDPQYQDAVESQAIYDVLERDIIPLFYGVGDDGLPRAWIARMKAAIRKICPVFNANRMVGEYMNRFYLPATERVMRLQENSFERARRLAAWQAKVRQAWPQLAVTRIEHDDTSNLRVGVTFRVRVQVQLGALSPDDLAVDLYLGRLDSHGELTDVRPLPMRPAGPTSDGGQWFETQVSPPSSGRHGFSIRILPHHEDLASPYEMNLILWA